ncbi:MAG: RdgB/HAM1 family non-canonical purine NTP pyrophosphatase [Ktedonobacterales bacterium]|nr:RdgB/HAM1 family non-canonical purine NTP pyrophosphatase [Ktedonobacterales bacterium]
MPQRRLLLATNNPHKVTEMRALLGDIPFDLVTPQDLGLTLEVAEPHATYLENATEKARSFADVSGELALADDSGLEIDALGGEPGVRSARFGAPDMPYPDRFALIEGRLAGLPPAQRTARFRCVLVLAAPPPDARHLHTEGVVEGQIAPAAHGTAGFGYDPIFWLPERGMTMAELTPAEKDAISHRGRAARAMATILRGWK